MVYLQPDHAYLADRHIKSVKEALEYFDEHLGKYPYSTITVVDPPITASGAGGMEYPTFITSGSVWGLPDEISLIEMVTIHEFGHNYFMGLLATNKFEEAWMDEGFNTYFEGRIMDHYYGEKTSFIGFENYHFGNGEMQRIGYTTMPNPKIAEVYRTAWGYPQGGYSLMSYNKTTTWMRTLQGLVGDDTMDEIMKTYFKRWKFKHPCANDFIAIVNEVVKKRHGDEFGENMNWFFDEVLYVSDVCDYKLASIKTKQIRPPKGILNDMVSEPDTTAGGEKLYNSKVIVYRLGDVVMPEEILVHFDNGDEVLEKWDGRSRTKEFSYERPEKVVWAKIDPDNKILVDINLMNNGKTFEPKKSVAFKYMVRFLFILQNILQTLVLFAYPKLNYRIMKIFKAYTNGLTDTLKQLRLITVSYLFLLIPGLLIALPYYYFFSSAINNYISPGNLLNGFDYTAYTELTHFEGDKISAAVSQATWLVIFFVLVSLFISAGILYVITGNRKGSLVNIVAGGTKYFWRFLKLKIYFIPIHLIVATLVYLPFSFMVMHKLDQAFNEKEIFYLLLPFLIIHFLILIYLFTINNYTKIMIVETDTRKVLKSIWRATVFVSKKFFGAYTLTILLSVVPVVLLFIFLKISGAMQPDSAGMIFIVFVIQQIYLWLRSAMKVWFMAGQVEYFRM